jgi:hypothetical protein
MERNHRTGRFAAQAGVVGFLLLLLLPRVASANTPLPSLYGFGAPFFLSITTFGLLILAVLLIETTVFRLGTGLSWRKSLNAAFLANLFSSVLGLLISGAPGFLILLLGVCFVFYHTFFYRWGYSRQLAIILGFLPALLSIPWALLTWPEGRGIQLWTVYASLVPAFLLSVIAEAVILRTFVNTGPVWRWVFLANGGSYVLFVIILLATSFSVRDNFLVTHYYLSTSAVSLAKSGKVARAMELVGMMQEMSATDNPDFRPYSLGRELDVARILGEKGHREEASSILDHVVENSGNLKEEHEELQEKIADIQRLLREY